MSTAHCCALLCAHCRLLPLLVVNLVLGPTFIINCTSDRSIKPSDHHAGEPSEEKSSGEHCAFHTTQYGGTALAYIPGCVRAPLAEIARCCRPSRPKWKRFVDRWAMSSRAATSSLGRKKCGVRSGRRDTSLSTRVLCAESALKPTFTRERCYEPGVYKGEGAMQQPLPRTSTIYYDDVSSGPRPKAHWYMLTHQCCSDTAPYWTPHRVAQSSGPYPRPLQRLSTSYHQVQSLNTKY